MSKSTLCVNFMFLLLSIALIFNLKVSTPRCRLLAKLERESITKCSTMSCVIHFKNQNGFSHVFLKLAFFVWATITNMAAP